MNPNQVTDVEPEAVHKGDPGGSTEPTAKMQSHAPHTIEQRPSDLSVISGTGDRITDMEPKYRHKGDRSAKMAKGKSNKGGEFQNLEDIMRKLIEKNKTSGLHVDLAYLPLLRALGLNNWEKAQDFISENPKALTIKLTEISVTLFHYIADSDQDKILRIVEKFAPMVDPKSLEQKDANGDTALSYAAAAGSTKVAKIFVKCNKNLPNIKSETDDLLPIQHAGSFGRKETFQYLLSVTGVEDSNDSRLSLFTGDSGVSLLKSLINGDLYGFAFNLLKRHPELAPDCHSCRRSILKSLARKPRAFASGSRLGIWQRLIYRYIPVKGQEEYISKTNDFHPLQSDVDTENPVDVRIKDSSKPEPRFLRKMAITFGALSQKLHFMFWNTLMQLAPSIKHIHDKKLKHMQSVGMVRMMSAGVLWHFEEASEILKIPILTAAGLGISEFVNEILMSYLDSCTFVDSEGNNIFQLAVLHRQEKVFNLIHQMGPLTAWLTDADKSGNNLLHLAGRLTPSTRVPGAALQMQRELQWFKAVENVVHASFRDQRNDANKTPREVFTEEHKVLVERGEQWMKDTASSCSVVAALIITVVFAAAYTVPGGNNSGGIPIFLHEPSFIVFTISDALALFSSTASVLMFLGILTSRYSEEDFLESLPRKLIIGLITLFFLLPV